jgi:hypothetical protein
MLERIFEQQQGLTIVTHPFSSSRGIQLSWMQSQTCADGMAADALSKYNAEVESGINNLRNELTQAEDGVCSNNMSVFQYDLLTKR